VRRDKGAGDHTLTRHALSPRLPSPGWLAATAQLEVTSVEEAAKQEQNKIRPLASFLLPAQSVFSPSLGAGGAQRGVTISSSPLSRTALPDASAVCMSVLVRVA